MCINGIKIIVIISDINSPLLYKFGLIKSSTQFKGIKKYLIIATRNIEYIDKKIVHDDFRYVAEIITGAKTNIEKGFNMPPFRNNKTPSWVVSNNKNKNTFSSEILSFFWKKKAPKFINTDSKIINIHSKNNNFISNIIWTRNIAANWPNIAIHRILIKFISNIVFTN